MEDLLGFIIFALIFIVGPLLEQMRKKQQPPQQKGPPRRVYEPEKPRQLPQPTQREEAAAAMVPDELWEILTGAPKPKPAQHVPPAPQPLPPDVEEETFEDEAIYAEEIGAEVSATREEAVSLEQLPVRWEPTVVSLETQPDPRARHDAFHKRIEQAPVPVAVATRNWLEGPQNMRRAIVMLTILGPPKGLE